MFLAQATTGPFRLRRGFSIGLERQDSTESCCSDDPGAPEGDKSIEESGIFEDEDDKDEENEHSFVGVFHQMKLAQSQSHLIRSDDEVDEDRYVLAERDLACFENIEIAWDAR